MLCTSAPNFQPQDSRIHTLHLIAALSITISRRRSPLTQVLSPEEQAQVEPLIHLVVEPIPGDKTVLLTVTRLALYQKQSLRNLVGRRN